MDHPKIFLNHLGQTTTHPLLIEIDHAEGIYLFDKKGKKYMDMIAGIAVSSLGHGNQRIKEALKKQIDKHLHVMVYGEFVQEPQVQLSHNLRKLLPKNLDGLYIVNSGTEAIEAAIKLCKAYTGRKELISFKGAYHGSTNGALSISSNEKRKENFRPLLPNIEFIELNNTDSLQAITVKTAGVFLETIQGDAGVQIPTLNFMQKLRQKCDETGALLVLDEIQCGLGRTGKTFAFEHFNIVPDLLTLGKSLGGGLPIGALISPQKTLATFSTNPELGHITTFGGHPLISAAAAEFCAILDEEINLGEVERLGKLIEENIGTQKGIIGFRRKGMLFAFDMSSAELVAKVVEKCLEKGLIIFWFLSHPNSFRLSPPLTITEAEIIKATNIIGDAIEESI
ncbi:MAG: aspartate aminotransferase family protein [Crocinitomicaceae bacterium]